jgi:hypothetical protein
VAPPKPHKPTGHQPFKGVGMPFCDIPFAWFQLKNSKNDKGSKKILGLISDIILAFVCGVVSMPVVVRWSGWMICWILFIYFLLNGFVPMSRLPRRTRCVLGLLLVVIFAGGFYGKAHSQWREEKGATLEGDLWLPDSNASGEVLQIGNSVSGTWFHLHVPAKLDAFRLFDDAGIKVENESGHLLLSTFVRDQQGKWVVQVDRNHWSVNPDRAICMDKNYTSDSLEVKDGRGHVVLQERLYPDRIQLQGEWFNDRGQGVEFVSEPNGFVGLYGMFDRSKPYQEIIIRPLFKYPSSQHWAEWESTKQP